MAQSRESLGCLALCAALAETHSIELSALVMTEMSRFSHVPGRLNPSISQWKSLIGTCSGCFAKSSFGPRVREFLDLQGLSLGEASNPEDIAKTLMVLSKRSSGELQHATSAGGSECAWLGCVAEWLLGLSVLVEKEDGTSLLSNPLNIEREAF